MAENAGRDRSESATTLPAMPLISSEHASKLRSWRRLRAAVWFLRLAIPLWIGGNVAAAHFLSPWFATWVFPSLYGAMLLPSWFVFTTGRCAACGEPYFLGRDRSGKRRGALASFAAVDCARCGLRLGANPTDAAQPSPP